MNFIRRGCYGTRALCRGRVGDQARFQILSARGTQFLQYLNNDALLLAQF